MVSFTVRRVLVTGGIGRIGHVTAGHFLVQGTSVTTVDVRNVHQNEAKLRAAADTGNAAIHCIVDDLLPLHTLDDRYARWEAVGGPFDVLINNAGRNAFSMKAGGFIPL